MGLLSVLHSQLAEACSNHTYQVVCRCCKLEIIVYLVLRYLITGEPPYEDWVEEWLQDLEV